MRTETIAIPGTTPGTTVALTVHRFGDPGARPKVYIQAALHADEMPGMLVADKLRTRLQTLEALGKVAGEVVLVPVANPIGLAQRVLGTPIGRFDLSDGVNFNRAFPYLTEEVARRVDGRLGEDAAANATAIRDAYRAALAELAPRTPAEHLKRALVSLAADADWVLDLHCDAEAVMHLYTLTTSAGAFEPLARLLGVEALLVAMESGGDPFDEALSRPWAELRERWPDRAIPLGCHATTVELRGQADVGHAFADPDAEAILGFLSHAGVLTTEPPALPPARCVPTPLAGSEPLIAPVAGIVAYREPVGARVEAGRVVAEIIDPATGTVTPVRTNSSGLLYTRTSLRFALPGDRLGKVAGTDLRRSGPLLSP